MRLIPFRLYLAITFGLGALITTATLISAQNQDKDLPLVPYPQEFRSWHHLSSRLVGTEHKSFPNRGGFHHFYANDLAMDGFRTGTFPNGAVVVDEGVLTKPGEGPAAGITFEGDRRSLDVMVKNESLYKTTGGWGFEHFDRDQTTGTLAASGRSACFDCHSKATRDHVFSAVRK